MQPVLLVVVAHPDDETFGTGSVIAHAAANGARVVVCCATRGEAGEDVSGATSSPAELATVREQELRAAGAVLGVDDIVVLDFADSGMTGAPPPNALVAVDVDAVVDSVAAVIEQLAPDVVVTLDPEAVNDHRDHMRIGEATTTAFSRVARPGARLYHWTLSRPLMDRWLTAVAAQGLLDEYIEMELGRDDAEITTIVDVTSVIDTRRAAIAQHRTQLSPFTGLPPALEHEILARDFFVRAVPAWTRGPVETDLFADLAFC